ncbi:MAG: hypothetical protein IPJ04_16355 [Candidatus Eisenbacteria bacterium]|nr:hypothetical protein [Candidatus Eisenbacteria bacterium]
MPITLWPCDASWMVYVSSLIARSDTLAPGKSVFAQYERSSIVCVSPASSSAASTAAVCGPNAASSSGESGSSYAAHASCCARMYGLCGSTHAASGERPKK